MERIMNLVQSFKSKVVAPALMAGGLTVAASQVGAAPITYDQLGTNDVNFGVTFAPGTDSFGGSDIGGFTNIVDPSSLFTYGTDQYQITDFGTTVFNGFAGMNSFSGSLKVSALSALAPNIQTLIFKFEDCNLITDSQLDAMALPLPIGVAGGCDAFSGTLFDSEGVEVGSYNILSHDIASSVPEPGALGLFGIGLYGVLRSRRRQSGASSLSTGNGFKPAMNTLDA
jgi:hypothetical protein